MRIEAKPWGKRIWIKNAVDESSYEIRNVRPLNEWHVRLHPCIDELEAREKKLERRLLILLHQLERCIEDAYAEPCGCLSRDGRSTTVFRLTNGFMTKSGN